MFLLPWLSLSKEYTKVYHIHYSEIERKRMWMSLLWIWVKKFIYSTRLVSVMVFLLWCFCDGVSVMVFVWWCLCDDVSVMVFMWWCLCDGVYVMVFLWWCFCDGVSVMVLWFVNYFLGHVTWCSLTRNISRWTHNHLDTVDMTYVEDLNLQHYTILCYPYLKNIMDSTIFFTIKALSLFDSGLHLFTSLLITLRCSKSKAKPLFLSPLQKSDI